MILSDVVESVGRTPLIKLKRLDTAGAEVLVKMESRNPCGSVKDRVGMAMIEDAEIRGTLQPGATLVEPTSGNTGIALAFAAAAKGYRLILTMPELISQERVAFLRMLGAEIVFTPGALMREAVRRAEQILTETPGAVMLQQSRTLRTPRSPGPRRRRSVPTRCRVVSLRCVGPAARSRVGEVLKARLRCRVWRSSPAGAPCCLAIPRPASPPGIGAASWPRS